MSLNLPLPHLIFHTDLHFDNFYFIIFAVNSICHLSIVDLSGGLGLGANPQPQLPDACEVQSLSISGDGGVSGAQIGGGSKKDVSPLEAVGHRYALDGTIRAQYYKG